MPAKVEFTVFTKFWKMPIPELARHVKALGFQGIELPIRPGYQVEPENVAKKLPEAARIFADHGLRISSVAAPADEPTIAACGAAGVPIIRVMVLIQKENYLAAELRFRKLYYSLVPALDAHHVTLGVQNHCDEFVCSMAGIYRLIEPFDPKHVAGVLDFCHCALAGEQPDHACDIIWDRLCLVNLKNCYRKRVSPPDAKVTVWEKYWCAAREGFAHWPTIAAELKKRDYRGDICFSAEYSDLSALETLVADDVAFAREIFAE